MNMHMNLFTASSLVFLINLPFGYWRANETKFSSGWFLSVHLPVPFVIAVRLLSGLGWQFATFPAMVGAFFLGQLAGGGVLRLRRNRSAVRLSSCLVWDVVGTVRDSLGRFLRP
jgi:hypothetical protein